jgi:4-oxalomesaconate tautomerase
MNLGDVGDKTVPKMCLVSEAQQGGAISTRTFIPHRAHEAIGVLGAVSVAAACLIPGSVAHDVAGLQVESGSHSIDVEHPTGFLTVEIEIDVADGDVRILRSSLLRTARKLMQGDVFVPAAGRSQ